MIQRTGLGFGTVGGTSGLKIYWEASLFVIAVLNALLIGFLLHLLHWIKHMYADMPRFYCWIAMT